jgi:hypothetical protein
MTKCWLISFLIAGLFGDKAFADCLPARDTPASVIEHFQKFNKPLPERFCAKEAAPEASQAEEAPDQYGGGDGPSAQYEGDPGGYQDDQGGGYQDDQGGGYQDDQGGGYPDDQEGGYPDDQGGYQDDQGGGYPDDQGGGYENDRDHDGGDYWKNDDNGHEGGEDRKGDGKKGKGHGKRKSACKKAHMKWNESTKTCSKRR